MNAADVVFGVADVVFDVVDVALFQVKGVWQTPSRAFRHPSSNFCRNWLCR